MDDESDRTGGSLDTQLSRRSLLQRIGWTAGGALLLGSAGVLRPTASLAALQATRTVAGGTVGLEVDGVITYLRAFEGGNAVADVMSESRGGDQAVTKRLAGVHFDDLVLKMSFDVAPSLVSWINETLGKGPTTRSGAIVFSDYNFVEWKRLTFSNAIISEIALPTADAQSKEAPLLTLRLTPEATRWTGGSGKGARPAPARTLRSIGGFNLNIQGMEEATQFVSKVEGLGVKRVTPQGALGQQRYKQLTVGALDVQPIRLYLAESRAAALYNWFDSFVIKGGGAAGEPERPGVLDWVMADRTTVVASVQMQNLGIVRYVPDPYASGGDQLPQVQVELYCERLSVSLPT